MKKLLIALFLLAGPVFLSCTKYEEGEKEALILGTASYDGQTISFNFSGHPSVVSGVSSEIMLLAATSGNGRHLDALISFRRPLMAVGETVSYDKDTGVSIEIAGKSYKKSANYEFPGYATEDEDVILRTVGKNKKDDDLLGIEINISKESLQVRRTGETEYFVEFDFTFEDGKRLMGSSKIILY